jgi:hypothetical protein
MSFSADYFSARERFLKTAFRLGCRVESIPVRARGPREEELTVDAALAGDEDTGRALVLTSGLHGIEGFFGSAVLCALLEQDDLSAALARGRIRVVMVHALNPFGFSRLRRAGEQNVDLNRNFLLTGDPYAGSPPMYRHLDPWLNPRRPPRASDVVLPRMLWSAVRLGIPVLKEAVAGGQYDFPHGLFYGGAGPAESHQLLDASLGRWIGEASQVLHLDFHTGLGRWATYKLLTDGPISVTQLEWLRSALGAGFVEESSPAGVSYTTRGGLGRWCAANFAGLDYTYLCAEFGTYPLWQMLAGLRAENQAHHWAIPESEIARRTKVRLKELFCPQSPAWRRQTIDQALRLIRAAMHALAS